MTDAEAATKAKAVWDEQGLLSLVLWNGRLYACGHGVDAHGAPNNRMGYFWPDPERDLGKSFVFIGTVE